MGSVILGERSWVPGGAQQAALCCIAPFHRTLEPTQQPCVTLLPRLLRALGLFGVGRVVGRRAPGEKSAWLSEELYCLPG